MSIYINDELVEQIKDRGNIVDLISEYLPLEKSGANYVGLCPFHNEKTPSFTVSDTKDFFHCFGCGESGDIISFVMKQNNLEFPEAVERLAEKYGIEVTKRTAVDKERESKRDRSFAINRESAKFFLNNLFDNEEAREYMVDRGLKESTIRKFGLGYALDDWEALHRYLLNLDYNSEDMEELGLVGARSTGNGFYDKFRNRIIFPIIDTRSRVIGFGGRVLDDSVPKYLNSQKTLVFDKGNFLYGINMVDKESDREDIILVEGYMDVLSLYDNDINYSVASLGTAFTSQQAKLLKRYGRNVFICYDADLAGREATDKAINILLKEGVRPRIIMLDGYEDPDDYFKEKNKDDFLELQRNALHFIDFKILLNENKYDLNDIDGKIKFIQIITKELLLIESSVERDIYINKISEELNISKKAIEDEMLGTRNKQKRKNRYVSKKNNRPKKEVMINLPSGNMVAEVTLINLMIFDKKYYNEILEMGIIKYFDNDTSLKIINIIEDEYINKDFIEKEDIYVRIKDEDGLDERIINMVLNRDISFNSDNIDKFIGDLIKTLKINRIKKDRDEIRRKIKELESNTDEKSSDDVNQLFKRLMELSSELETIRYDDRG